MPSHRTALLSLTALLVSAALLPSAARADDCTDWDFSGHWEFQMSNGEWASFDAPQPISNAPGKLQFFKGGSTSSYAVGWAKATVRGPNFIVDERDEAAQGNVWLRRFAGIVGPDGKLTGQVPDGYKLIEGHSDGYVPPKMLSFYEKSGHKPVCTTGGGRYVPIHRLKVKPSGDTKLLPSRGILTDVDLYAEPGGKGKPIGMLKEGETYSTVNCRDDKWCEIPGKGWIWGDAISK
jgi:hypothetical protein